jgi:hypothetical protein
MRGKMETRRVSKGEHRWTIHPAAPSLTRRASNPMSRTPNPSAHLGSNAQQIGSKPEAFR